MNQDNRERKMKKLCMMTTMMMEMMWMIARTIQWWGRRGWWQWQWRRWWWWRRRRSWWLWRIWESGKGYRGGKWWQWRWGGRGKRKWRRCSGSLPRGYRRRSAASTGHERALKGGQGWQHMDNKLFTRVPGAILWIVKTRPDMDSREILQELWVYLALNKTGLRRQYESKARWQKLRSAIIHVLAIHAGTCHQDW